MFRVLLYVTAIAVASIEAQGDAEQHPDDLEQDIDTDQLLIEFCISMNPQDTSCPSDCDTNLDCTKYEGGYCSSMGCGNCRCIYEHVVPVDTDQLLIDECVPHVTDHACPASDCKTDNDCEKREECINNNCGSCNCFPITIEPKDCCWTGDEDCPHDCVHHRDCKTGQLCLEITQCGAPNTKNVGCQCEGGVHPPLDCVATNPECPDECDFHTSCPPGASCQITSCGGCECVVDSECCPDMYLHPFCEVGCDSHTDCPQGQVCTRNDCGGCGCEHPVVPVWADCWANYLVAPSNECPDDCQIDAECAKGMACRSVNACGCQCVAVLPVA